MTPPFSGVLCSGHGCGLNVGSHVFRGGFTDTSDVPVSAISSADIGDPASVLGGPGFEMMSLRPSGKVGSGVTVTIVRIPAVADKHPITQCHSVVTVAAP